MLRSLRLRLVVLFLIPLLVAGGLALGLTARSVVRYGREQTERRLAEQVQGVAEVFGGVTHRWFSDPETPLDVSPPIRRITSAEIFYVPNPAADFACDGCVVQVWPGLQLDWSRLKKHAQLTLEGVPPKQDERYLLVASAVWRTRTGAPPRSAAIDPVGAIVLARPLSRLAPSQTFWARRLAPAFLIGVAAALLLAVLLGFRIVSPLRRLVAASAAIARGRFDLRLDVRRRDEIGQLNRAFGAMAGELAAAREHERQFLMRVSHELRTPLTAIQGHVDALADGIVETPLEREQAYAVIAAESDRLERLIADLLDLAKLEARRFTLRRDHVDVAALLEQCVAARRESARAKDVELELLPGDAGTIVGDGDRVLQIASNLVENAIRWTPPGGIVRVRLSRTGETVQIAVADSGPGVAPERRADVFRPFYSEDGKGTGLGLAIASELAAAMGGRLQVEDAPEGGALFVCTLPRTSVAPQRILTPTA